NTRLDDFDLGDLPSHMQRVVEFPARSMTAGDIAARKLLQEAGFSELEARRLTLTSEPFTGFGKAFGNARKSKGAYNNKQSMFMKIALPFYRTNINQIEQGLIRVPVVGELLSDYW